MQTIIFDFDGTIADTHRHSVDIFNTLAGQYNFRPIAWDRIDQYKGLSAAQLIRRQRVPIFKIPKLIGQAKKQYHHIIHELKPFVGMAEALHALRKHSIKMGVLSSNSKENIHAFLKHHHLEVFDFIETTPRILGKNVAIKKTLAKHHLLAASVIYIGDEIRDILSCRKAGIRVAAAGWGFNSPEILKKQKPHFLLRHPEDLLSLVK